MIEETKFDPLLGMMYFLFFIYVVVTIFRLAAGFLEARSILLTDYIQVVNTSKP